MTEIETHPLQFPWTFTFFKKMANRGYEENTSMLGTTETVEDFWRLYVHLRRPLDDRPTVCDYHVFREGIKPMWEDETNVNGGKWIVRLKKGVAARYWEDLLLALLGGQFRVGDEICGVVLSVRYQEDILSVWNKSADSRRVCMQIRDTLRSVLALPIDASLDYKKHTDSMRDNSSYRNATANFGEAQARGGEGGGRSEQRGESRNQGNQGEQGAGRGQGNNPAWSEAR